MTKNILLTGGAGFIASHVTRLLANKYPHYKVSTDEVEATLLGPLD